MKLYMDSDVLKVSTQLILVLFLANIADFILTKNLMDVFGVGVEFNPLMKGLVEETGSVYSILVAKLIGIGFLWSIRNRIKPSQYWLLWLVVLLTIGVILWSSYLNILMVLSF